MEIMDVFLRNSEDPLHLDLAVVTHDEISEANSFHHLFGKVFVQVAAFVQEVDRDEFLPLFEISSYLLFQALLPRHQPRAARGKARRDNQGSRARGRGSANFHHQSSKGK